MWPWLSGSLGDETTNAKLAEEKQARRAATVVVNGERLVVDSFTVSFHRYPAVFFLTSGWSVVLNVSDMESIEILERLRNAAGDSVAVKLITDALAVEGRAAGVILENVQVSGEAATCCYKLAGLDFPGVRDE